MFFKNKNLYIKNMKRIILLIFFVFLSREAFSGSVKMRIIKGMSFEKLKSRNYSTAHDYYFCEGCAEIEVVGEPKKEMMYFCSLEPIKNDKDKIELSDCFVVQDGGRLNNTFVLDKNGRAILHIGSKANISSNIESGVYEGILNLTIKEIN